MGTSRQEARFGPGVRGFTLIELLVVVAIIALLVSILLPTLGRAKEQARQSYCLSSLRNIAVGLNTYDTDWGVVPYNYAFYGSYNNDANNDGLPDHRWMLGALTGFVGGSKTITDLRTRVEGEFPDNYICPSADLPAVLGANPNDMYHACYWTNVALRVNRGYGNLFRDLTSRNIAGNDFDSGGEARYTGRKACTQCGNWRSVYNPQISSITDTSGFAVAGDTNNAAYTIVHQWGSYATLPGDWHLRPGWGHIGGQLGWDRHQGKIMISYADAHAAALSWEQVVADFTFFAGSSRNWEDGAPTGDFMVSFSPSDVCTYGISLRQHKLPPVVVE